jgi:hypothetical protein
MHYLPSLPYDYWIENLDPIHLDLMSGSQNLFQDFLKDPQQGEKPEPYNIWPYSTSN